MNNVSSLVPTQINNTLNSVNLPQAFGDQVKDAAKQKIKQVALGQLDKLRKEAEDIIVKKTNLEVKHKSNLNKLEQQYNPKPPKEPLLTEKEYNAAVEAENISYELEKKTLQEQYDKKQEQIQSIVKDPNLKYKKKLEKFKTKRQSRKNKSKAEKAASRTALLKNIAKQVEPILSQTLLNLISQLVVQNLGLQDLVDQTNEIIDTAQTPAQLDQARVTRNSAYNTLDSNEKVLINVQNTLELIQLVISITEALIPLLFINPTPPLPLIKSLQDRVALLNRIIGAIINLLDPIVAYLNDLKNQLREVDNKLDIETINSLPSLDRLNNLLNTIKQPQNELYKGFKLVIKEDNDPRTTVQGVKRHYAVAIDRSGVEVLKSQYSYTLEPNILIDQLKLVIDRQNLQA
jgi:hypothetical protein